MFGDAALASFGFEGLLNKEKEGAMGLGLIPGSVINLKDLGCNLNVPMLDGTK